MPFAEIGTSRGNDSKMEGFLKFILEDDSREESPGVSKARGAIPKNTRSTTPPNNREEKSLKKERSRSPRKPHAMIVDAKANAMANEEAISRSPSQLATLTRVSSFKKSSPSPLRRFSSNTSISVSPAKTESLKRKPTQSSESSAEHEEDRSQTEQMAYFKLTETHLFLSFKQSEVCSNSFLFSL